MEISIEDPIAVLARERFGLKYLFPYQRLVVANVLDAEPGLDPDFAESLQPAEGKVPENEKELRQIVLLPTGFGKSLCFQLPALLIEGPTIVVYPLLALMSDQKRRLDELGIDSAILKGGQTARERIEALDAIKSKKAKIVITNPETLRNPELSRDLAKLEPGHIAIDEAHCVSEWGESFRPAYLELGETLKILGSKAISAFTATASPPVLEAIGRHLFRSETYRIVSGDADRPNLSYSVEPTLSRMRTLERLLLTTPKPALVFCSSREGTEISAESLARRLGIAEIRFYHAGLTREEKRRIEEWFYASDSGILVTTCAYGMGVDKKNIRSVIHMDAPGSIEAYLQEAGRAGRDGLASRASLIIGPDEETRATKESDASRRARRNAIVTYARSLEGCRREALLQLLGSPLSGPCSGCDLCEGKRPVEEGLAEISAIVKANPRRFNAERMAAFLMGARQLEPPCCAASASLSGWRKEDVEEAIAATIKKGILRAADTGPWKGLTEAAHARSVDHLFARILGALGAGSGRSGGFGGFPRARSFFAPARQKGAGFTVHETHVSEKGPDEEHRESRADNAKIGKY